MKKKYCLTLVFACMLAAAAGHAADAPHELAGFVLGQPLADFEDRVIMETALPVRYYESFREVEIKPIEGFKSGLIGYGTCHKPGHIARIKLKYADSSKSFFNKLLKLYKKRFGEPGEYTGDAFQIFISWKWSFVDPNGQRISLTLQHNESDEDEKIGNAVKLTLSDLVESEIDCFRNQQPGDKRQALRQTKWDPLKLQGKGWDRFLPK